MRSGTISICRSVAIATLIVAALAGCSSSSTTKSATPPTTTAPAPRAVGQMTKTFVDPHRSTPTWSGRPAHTGRTLVTTIYYPAEGAPNPGKARTGATPAQSSKPSPMIVFAHGFAANPQVYAALLIHWAAAGFVVVAPLFPLTGTTTPGGPDAGDVVNQPADMSFVMDSVLKLSTETSGTLSGLVDPNEIGAAGHSNGAITTVGLVANTCCRDKRIKATAVLSGTMEAFPRGRYVFADTPPLLVVHGTADQLIPYEGGVDIFNAALGPKGLLTIKDGNHMSTAALVPTSSQSVMTATTDFFDAYLRGDKVALARLEHDGSPGVATMRFVATEGSKATIPTVPTARLNLHATVTPSTNLVNDQTVTVNWDGYTPGKVVNVLQCSADDANLTNQAGCDFKHAKILHPDPTGTGSMTMQVIAGKVGTSTCDAKHPGCFIIVNDASSTDPASMFKVPISFAP